MADAEPSIMAHEQPPTTIRKVEKTQRSESKDCKVGDLDRILLSRRPNGTAKYWRLLTVPNRNALDIEKLEKLTYIQQNDPATRLPRGIAGAETWVG